MEIEYNGQIWQVYKLASPDFYYDFDGSVSKMWEDRKQKRPDIWLDQFDNYHLVQIENGEPKLPTLLVSPKGIFTCKLLSGCVDIDQYLGDSTDLINKLDQLVVQWLIENPNLRPTGKPFSRSI